jgi:hypothetical protein
MTGTQQQPIRYIALDFDNCICEINDAFRIVWDFLDSLIFHPELSEHWHELQKLWVIELDKALCDGKLTFLNKDVLMLLKHVYHGDLEVKPTVFVYTNNTNELLVTFLRDIIALNMRIETPWTKAFFPSDSRRAHEFSQSLASDEPGKSFAGMKACMGNPDDMTPESLVFLDDLLHPIRHTLGKNYVHIDPPFRCKDKLLPYLESLIKAIQKLNMSVEHMVEFRLHLRNYLHSKSSNLKYFPAPRDSYREWNLIEWKDFIALFHSFGGYIEDEDEDEDDSNLQSLDIYYKCRDLLTQTQVSSAS